MSSREWRTVSVSEVTEIIGGGTPKTKIESYWNGDIPWLSVVDFNNDFRRVYITEKTITEEGLRNSSTKLLNAGDIIISARGTVGALAQLSLPMAFNQSCYGLRANSKTMNDFLYYALKNIVEKIKANTHGSVFDTITRNTFDNLIVNLPPLPEQKAITATLSCLDDKIELNNRMNKNLEEMAQAIFKSWFVDFEPFQDGEFEESELGMIPKGWRVGTLSDYIEIHTKTVNPLRLNDAVLEHYSIPAYDERKMPVFENASDIKSNKYIVSRDCFLVSKLNPSTKRYWRPFCFTKNSVCSTEFIVYSSKNKHHLDFYFLLMSESKFYNFLLSSTTGSTNSRQRANPANTLNYSFILPSEEAISSFVRIVEKLFLQMQVNVIESEKLAKTRDTLLPKLMSGEIRVPIEEVQ